LRISESVLFHLVSKEDSRLQETPDSALSDQPNETYSFKVRNPSNLNGGLRKVKH